MTPAGAGRRAGGRRPQPARAAVPSGAPRAALPSWAPLVAVALLAVFLADNRIRLTRGLEYFDPRNGDCLFWTEGAVQFRYARMAADGKPIPERDVAIQWPEGIAPRESLCLLMERCVGGSYRALAPLFGRPPFHVWAAYAPHVVAALAVPAAFALGSAAWGSAWAGVLAAALYAFSLATVARSIGSFGHEDFALPFLFVASACLVRILARRERAAWPSALDGPVAALTLAIGLGAWHFSRFAYLVIVAALGARLVSAPDEARPRVARALAWATAGALAGGVAFEVLRASRFLISPPFFLSVALLAGYALEARLAALAPAIFASRASGGADAPRAPIGSRLRRLGARALPAALILLPLLAAARLIPTEREGYAHVYGLFLAKLRFLGMKPEDPALLSPEARSLWIEDFASPSVYLVVVTFGIPIALAAWALRAGSSRREPARREALALLVVLAVVWGVSFLLVKRLFVFWAFYLAALAGGAARAAFDPGTLRLRAVPLLLILAGVGIEAYKVVTHGSNTFVTTTLKGWLKRRAEPLTIPNWHANDLAIVDWIRNRTKPEDAFVARIGASPMVLTYAGRPVALHSKFEVPGIRARARALGAALYGEERELYRFCRETGAAYYLHEPRAALEPGPDSERYVGCARRLPASAAAYRLQFAGEESRYFEPLYRNMSYCLYRVLDPADTGAVREGTARRLPPQPLYEISRFGGQSLDEEFFDDGSTREVVSAMEEAVALLVRAQAEIGARRFDRALPLLERARAINPSLAGVNTYLGLALAMRNDNARALEFCAREIAISPDLPLAYTNLGFVEANLGLYDEARSHLERAIAMEPNDPGPRSMLAQVQEIVRTRAASRPGVTDPSK